jgi:hypothetical protein
MHPLQMILLSMLLFFGCSSRNQIISSEKNRNCFPVPFDHFWFRVDKNTYDKIAKSDYFKQGHFSFFEPNKSPWGKHFGHYITGELHHLEVFVEEMPTNPEPLGIGFIAESPGCLKQIHEKLSSLDRSFIMKSEANWGTYTQLEENKSLAVWVSELKPEYINAPDGSIGRESWLKKMREMNSDPYKGKTKFKKIKKVTWAMEQSDLEFLGLLFVTLGWNKLDLNIFEYDGTTVVLQKTNRIHPNQALKELILQLNESHHTAELGSIRTLLTSSPKEILIIHETK